MKTVALLHREQLTDLFILVSKYIGTRMTIVHIAYSDKEVQILRKSGIEPNFNYSQIIAGFIDENAGLNQDLLQEIDDLFISQTNGRFNINSSLQSDRGYSVLEYDEALLLAQSHYQAWQKIFYLYKVDLMVHEPCSLFFNHLGAVMCKAQGGLYLYHSMAAAENEDICYLNITSDDFSCEELESSLEYYLGSPDKIDKERCLMFIDKFRSNFDVYLSNIQPHRNILKYRISSLKNTIVHSFNSGKYDRLKNNIEYWLNSQNLAKSKVRNYTEYKKHKLNFEIPVANEKYYYYSFHLEPEAVVLYLGDGIYANQIKLIENIAASLPVGNYLYVKDHPHEFAYRSVDDFLRLIKIPNVRLIQSSISGKSLIKNAIGVFTINGTAGFEGLMLGKQVYCFGKSYYTCSKRINYIHNIRDLREKIYENKGTVYVDDVELLAFVNAYLDSLHVGMVDYFMNRAIGYGIDLDKNANRIANDLVNFSQRF